MNLQSSSTSFLHLAAIAFLAVFPQISNGAPMPAASGLPIRGTPIDSPPETNTPPAPVGSQPKPIPTNLSPATSLPGSEAEVIRTNQGRLEIGFDKLSGFSAGVIFERTISNGVMFAHATKMTGEIPQTIQALNDQKVAVKGFMLPLHRENGLATDFILLRSRMMCCYGMPPNINEWIHVRMGDKGARCIMDTPVTIWGKLHVREYRENRTMLGIYQLEGEKLEVPE